jgi:Skp family chaperone for outer membrane proteins
VLKQKKIALRMVQNALRNEVNRLNEENDKLAQEIDDLEVQVQRVKEKEMQLENITKQQGINSQTFLELVNTKVYVTQFLILYTVSPYFVFYLTSN